MDVDGARVAARVAPLEERSPWRHWLHMEAVSSVLLSEHHNHLRPRATAVPRYSLFTQPRRRISMKMSSRRAALERSFVTQHRPQDVDPPSSQRDQSLSVPLTFSSLALVEGSGLRSAAQAGKGRLV